MPFGPAIAIFVFVILCFKQHLAEQEAKRKAEEKKKKEKEKEHEQRVKLLAEIIKDSKK